MCSYCGCCYVDSEDRHELATKGYVSAKDIKWDEVVDVECSGGVKKKKANKKKKKKKGQSLTEIDKELIAMCDTPEIQARWEPKVGDRVANFIRTTEEIDKDTFKRGRKYVGEIILTSAAQVEHKDLATYTPRIEDVLEWLVPRFMHLTYIPTKRTWKSSARLGICQDGSLGHGQFDLAADTAIKALLKSFMHLGHNKTWNGEWV